MVPSPVLSTQAPSACLPAKSTAVRKWVLQVLMATNRPDTLDPALLRPGRLDRKVEFGLPDLESRTQIFQIHTRTMNCERDIRFELLARLCPNSTGADVRSVCTEAGMFAIRARRKTVTEKDFLDAVNKVDFWDIHSAFHSSEGDCFALCACRVFKQPAYLSGSLCR